MRSDKDRFLRLLEEFGLTPTRVEGGDEHTVFLVAGEGRFEGYPGFFATFRFEPDGEFKDAGSWEGL